MTALPVLLRPARAGARTHGRGSLDSARRPPVRSGTIGAPVKCPMREHDPDERQRIPLAPASHDAQGRSQSPSGGKHRLPPTAGEEPLSSLQHLCRASGPGRLEDLAAGRAADGVAEAVADGLELRLACR
jgi:hypothetical protein